MRQTGGGFILLTCLLVITGLLSLTMIALMRSTTDLLMSERSIANAQIFYLAEAAIDLGHVQFVQDTENDVDPQTTDRCTLDEAADWVVIAIPGLNENLEYCTDPVGELTPETLPNGQYRFAQIYRIAARPSGGSRILEEYLKRTYTPVFQYLTYYNGTLEIAPGVDMTLNGKVFTNEDLYLYPGHELTFSATGSDTAMIASAGRFYAARGFNLEGADPDFRHPGGTINVHPEGEADPDTFVPVPLEHWDDPEVPGGALFPLDDLAPDWVETSTALWGNTFQTAAHGVTQQELPEIASLQHGDYFDALSMECGVKVLASSSGTPDVSVGQDSEDWDSVFGDDVPPTSEFTDWREFLGDHQVLDNAQVINIDVKRLQRYLRHYSNNWDADDCPDGFNGVVYVTWNEQPVESSGAFGAVRLLNGGGGNFKLDTAFVSDGPVYIQGDFNPGPPTSRKAVSVLSDALTILSPAWDNHESNPSIVFSDSYGVPPRVAPGSIEVNGAFATGIVETGTCGNNDCYSGGLENYPRFLESWGMTKTVSITGSFVQLWASEIATSGWKPPNVLTAYLGLDVAIYKPPVRDWDFDINFLNMDGLPPHPPIAVGQLPPLAWHDGFHVLPEP